MKVATYTFADLDKLLEGHESVITPRLDKQSGPLTVLRRPSSIHIVDNRRMQRVELYPGEGQSLRHRGGQLTRISAMPPIPGECGKPVVVGLVKGVHSFNHGPYRIRLIPPERDERMRLEDLLPAILEIRPVEDSACNRPTTYKVQSADAWRWQLNFIGNDGYEQSIYLPKKDFAPNRAASLVDQGECLVIALLKERSFQSKVARDK
jgi:hypothetical protein